MALPPFTALAELNRRIAFGKRAGAADCRRSAPMPRPVLGRLDLD
jgi:hypothetical protein